MYSVVVNKLLMLSIIRSARSEVAEQPLPEDTIPTSKVSKTGNKFQLRFYVVITTIILKELKTNGTTASSAAAPAVAAVTTSNEREKSMSHSAEHLSISSLKEDSDRAGTLSAARSFDPLPEVPKLELAEGGSKEKSGEDDNDDDDDDDPYAEVLVDNVDRMADSESDGERGSNGDGDGDGSSPKKPPGGVSPAPPYGKVSRHTKPPAEAKQEEADSDSYAEVRDVIRRGPMFSSRERSQTDPPAPAGLGVPRERRALTESATHMPLPDIPAADGGMHPVIVEESEMYDSIPESGTKNASPASSHSVAGKRKERLYESVDEMAEKDLYESVPDNFPKVNSPVRPQPVSTPALSPTKRVSEAPLPPSSPIPSKNELHKKKGLEKTLSAAAQQEEKRRFSFFGRKKPGSVTKTKKGEQPESPTALVSSISPQHKSPPLPNIPIPPPPNEDDDEDTYDKVTPSLIGAESNEIFQQLLANKAKSTSLPRICGAGGRPNLPLPRLPEDSGSATVQHKRVIEGSRGPDEYDTVNVSAEQILDEPNYDTVKVEDIFMLPVAGGGADPPYDKIDKQELQEFREREKQSRENLKSMSSEPNDSNLSGGYSKVRGETPEGELDQSGLPPDHDEEGYAVVPEEIRLRKRAMSASQGVRRDLSPDSVAAGYHVIGHDDTIREARSHTVSVSPKKSASGNASRENVEDQYACIDLGAKKKQRELEEVLRLQEELRAYSEEPHSTSPVPPPLPPALSPDDMEEYKQPPIPSQSEGMHELMGDGLKVSQSDTADPPYARVKSKSDNPYAEVSRPYAEVDVSSFQNQSKAGAGGSTDDSLDEAMGYDIVGGTLGVKTKIAQKDKPYDTIENVVSGQIHESGGVSEDTLDEALGYDVDGTVGVKAKLAGKKVKPYDTIADVKVDMPSQLEQDMPILETAESAAVNIYDTLFPEDEEEDARYDVIDKPRNTPRSMV